MKNIAKNVKKGILLACMILQITGAYAEIVEIKSESDHIQEFPSFSSMPHEPATIYLTIKTISGQNFGYSIRKMPYGNTTYKMFNLPEQEHYVFSDISTSNDEAGLMNEGLADNTDDLSVDTLEVIEKLQEQLEKKDVKTLKRPRGLKEEKKVKKEKLEKRLVRLKTKLKNLMEELKPLMEKRKKIENKIKNVTRRINELQN